MRCSNLSVNGKSCVCALLLAMPCVMVLANAQYAYAQTTTEDDAESSKSIIRSAIGTFARAHHQSDDKSALDAFYAARDYRAAWTGSQEAYQRATQLRAILEKADAHGLDAASYKIGQPPDNKEPSTADGALYDVALTDAVLRYARDVQLGRVRPQAVYRDIDLPRRKPESPAAIARALDAGTGVSFIADLAPEHAGYRGLVRAIGRYRDIAAAGGWPTVFSTNENDPINRKLLIKRLAAEDTVLAKNPNPSAEVLQSAIARYQTRNGLKPDGQLGPNTMAALNTSVASRIQQIAANMERWRWMPAEFESRYAVVNIPDQTLEFVRDGATVMKSRVMVGKKSTRTPILRAEATTLVVNPPWNVPGDIAARQILPNLKRNPNYLAAHNMVLVDGPDGDPRGASIRWDTVGTNPFPYQIRQLPGPNSAMGTLMLDGPNRFDVYLHDTPGKAFFQSDDRELSNGCIRVQDMMTLASFALSSDTGAGTNRLNDIVASRNTRRMTLEDPLPIYMVYWTAIADADGNVEFRPDRYDRDPPLIKAMAKAPSHDSDED